ncbi:MAG TPA: AAA family ATPase, partial [Gemmatimonadales bacterium]|nr:AAA family ATPase [Gemmatimonadales bacterium]
MAPHLHLLTLGAPLLLTEAGEQIRFRTRKHFALLIRLTVETGRKLTRDYLMDLLWPNVPASRARHSLAQALSVLREKVGRERLIVQRTSIALAPGAVAADVLKLESCETEVRGPFLEGFDVPGAVRFEQWKDEWRAKLMPRIRDCLVKQMDAGRRIGNFEAVEEHAHILLELDPLCEDGVRGVMEARAWVGDRTNALKAYGRFAARLAEELGAKPSPDLARVADLLREGRRATSREPTTGHVSERQERRFEAETLIGREREFARLYDAWLEVRRREPRIVVLLGDPGVGKTTLANAFVSSCQMEGAAIARAQAYDAERELPFGVLAELIKQLTLQRAIGGADPEALSELTRVSPEIFTVFPGVPKPVEWSAEVVPLRLADAFLKAVEAAAEESPLVLVVDDIHAADNATVAILHGVARKLPRARLLMILTARASELRMAESSSALATDAAIEALRTLVLEPLPPPAAERLVTVRVTKAEARVEDVPVARIIQAGNGNPLALELLTKEWIAHGSSSLLSDLDALNTQPVANLGIPRAIGAVFERQIRRLDAPTRAALDLAAVLGRRLADLPLYEVVELSPALAGEALSRLREEGLLREVQGGLEFRNELIRAQAYYAVAGPARQYLHR